jgi:ribonucleoside-diphosphate reductase beta chain
MTTPTRYTTTNRSFRTDILPWRLYQKGKQLAWDPADLDFTQDAKDWAEMDDEMKLGVSRLATTFMAGEEAVTLDIVPLIRAVSDEGRAEETLFLTTFLGDEAKHAEMFRTWFDVVGVEGNLDHLLTDAQRQIFDVELPNAMRRLDSDRSPEAFLDAALTYNHFVEGVLAMTGYRAWSQIFAVRNAFPGLQKGIEMVQRDERRHLAYGTYLCRRIVAEHPETWTFIEKRMERLRELGLAFVDGIGNAIFEQFETLAGGNKEMLDNFRVMAQAFIGEFTAYGEQQLERRLKVIEVAKTSSVSDIETSTVEEELETELERV